MLCLQVLLLLNREVKSIEEETADCRERLQGWKEQLLEADRSVTQFEISIVFRNSFYYGCGSNKYLESHQIIIGQM